MTNKKMTKKDYFKMLKSIDKVAENDELVKFIDHEIELLDRKNSADRKLSGNALANVGLKEEIIEIFQKNPAHLFTATEVQKAMKDEYSNQRISALLKQLKNDGKVEKIQDKRKSFFKLACPSLKELNKNS